MDENEGQPLRVSTYGDLYRYTDGIGTDLSDEDRSRLTEQLASEAAASGLRWGDDWGAWLEAVKMERALDFLADTSDTITA